MHNNINKITAKLASNQQQARQAQHEVRSCSKKTSATFLSVACTTHELNFLEAISRSHAPCMLSPPCNMFYMCSVHRPDACLFLNFQLIAKTTSLLLLQEQHGSPTVSQSLLGRRALTR